MEIALAFHKITNCKIGVDNNMGVDNGRTITDYKGVGPQSLFIVLGTIVVAN